MLNQGLKNMLGILLIFWICSQNFVCGESEEFVRLPLLVNGNLTGVVVSGNRLPLADEFFKNVEFVGGPDGEEREQEESELEDHDLRELLPAGGDEGDDEGDCEFDEVDLIEFVRDLERQADVQERSGIFSEILDVIHGKGGNGSEEGQSKVVGGSSSSTEPPIRTLSANASLQISLDENGDLQLPTEDISDFSEEIVDGITAGIEESLRMSDDLELDETNNMTFPPDNSSQTRQFSVYLFQGQYYAEPRLNRFIDGALRNMGSELRVASMDPLFFRVLPRGQVAERDKPLLSLGTSGLRRRRPQAQAGGGRVKRQMGAFFRPLKNKLQQQQKRKRIIRQNQKVTRVSNGLGLTNRRRQQQLKLQQQKRRQQRIRQQKLQQLRNKKRQQQQKRKQQNNQQLLQRIRRRIKQDVGGGRVEGLSKVTRDGDAEMQLFGNYTLIRSHMKMGPVEITMQFRTKNGLKRSGATLPVIRAHTVTRVNHEGSEMIDYLLDRPHPETIRVRGTLFPLAQQIARNIFSRLFLPTSFLTQKLREKAGLAYLSKPIERKRRRRRR